MKREPEYTPQPTHREISTEYALGQAHNLFSCSECGAVVASDTQELHTRWHGLEAARSLFGTF